MAGVMISIMLRNAILMLEIVVLMLIPNFVQNVNAIVKIETKYKKSNMMPASIHPPVNIELDMIFNCKQSFSCGTRNLIQVGTTFLFLQIGADNLQPH